jgi:hypothetical protein
MEVASMKQLLSSFLVIFAVICGPAIAAAQTATNGQPMTAKQRAVARAQLMKDKQVSKWPRPGTNMPPVTIDLSAEECETLGGRLKVDNNCGFGITCVGSNGGRACITEMKQP